MLKPLEHYGRMSEQKKRHLISITVISLTLGPSLCKSFSGFYIFTGSDYTSALVCKGKTRPYDRLMKSPQVPTV